MSASPTRSDAGLDPDWRVVLDPGLQRLDGDRVLIGGYPTRVLRLTDSGAAAVAGWARGEAVGDSAVAGRLARRLVEAGAAHPVPPVGAAGRVGLALVVPTRNHPDGLAAVLAGALRPGFGSPQAGSVPEETVVVDDGSADPLAVARVADRFGARVLRNDLSLGPAAARNRGWRVTTAAVVAFLDDDCRCPDGPAWTAPLLDHLTDPAVALAAPRVRSRRGPAPGWLGAYESVASPLDLGPQAAPIRRGSPVSYVPAAALVVRRAALERVGGFDEELQVGEDVDFEWRLVEAGWALRYEPRATVTHDARPDLAAWARQRFRYGTSAVALHERRPGAVAPLHCSAGTAAAWTLAATATPVGIAAGAAVAGGSAVLLSRRLGPVPAPQRTAWRLTRRGHTWAGGAMARAARREWWPFLVAGLVTRRGRRLGFVVVLSALLGSRARSSGIGMARFAALRVADDVAYGTGVWSEAVRRRCFGALLPTLGHGPRRAVAREETGNPAQRAFGPVHRRRPPDQTTSST